MDDWVLIILVALFAIPITIGLLNGLVERIKDQAPSTQQLNQELKNKIEEYESLTQRQNENIERCNNEYEQKKSSLEREYQERQASLRQQYIDYKTYLQSDYDELQQKANDTKIMYENKIADFESYIQEKCERYPHLAAIMADLLTLHYETSADYLDHKKNPAYTEAYRIRELRKETKEILAQKKEIEYRYAYILQMYPNITDIFDSGFNEDQAFELETEENTDRVRLLLSPEEYQKLSVTERNQLALDRYVANRKSNWQIGRDYEMFIGYQYERQGYRVSYTGILKNLEDMGRDLIVTNQEKAFIIQCKNWSKSKTIHEKHIFQLFGTVVLYNIDHPKKPAVGVFVTTTQLSDKAMQIAEELNVMVVHKEAGDFPRIKCNINKTTGERIYHLPFDQQYDRTVVEINKGELYAFTVEEAERQGFRRAFKHFS